VRAAPAYVLWDAAKIPPQLRRDFCVTRRGKGPAATAFIKELLVPGSTK